MMHIEYCESPPGNYARNFPTAQMSKFFVRLEVNGKATPLSLLLMFNDRVFVL